MMIGESGFTSRSWTTCTLLVTEKGLKSRLMSVGPSCQTSARLSLRAHWLPLGGTDCPPQPLATLRCATGISSSSRGSSTPRCSMRVGVLPANRADVFRGFH